MSTGTSSVNPSNSGQRKGRLHTPIATQLEVSKLRALGLSKSKIAKKLCLNPQTVTRILGQQLPLVNPDVSQSLTVPESTNPLVAMERAGLTRDKVTQALARALEASEHKLATWEGKFTDERIVPDNPARNKAIELAAKILGLFPDDTGQQIQQLLVRLPDAKVTPEEWNRSIETITVLPGEPVTLTDNTSSNESTSTPVSDEGTKGTGSPSAHGSAGTDESPSTHEP